MMKFTEHRSQIRTLKQDDPRFKITDGFVTADRAGIEVGQDCPYEYLLIISKCIDRGWIKPVAHVTERELLFMGLTRE